jgi:hypothetical protein
MREIRLDLGRGGSEFVLVACLIAGCHSAPAGPKLEPVSGTITLDGKPLAAADLIFVPQGDTKGQSGVARTDADGKYELMTPDRKHKGVALGSFRVVINKLVKPDGSDYVPDPNAGPIDTGGFKELLPVVYSDMGQAELEANVPEGGATNLDFKLSSKKR